MGKATPLNPPAATTGNTKSSSSYIRLSLLIVAMLLSLSLQATRAKFYAIGGIKPDFILLWIILATLSLPEIFLAAVLVILAATLQATLVGQDQLPITISRLLAFTLCLWFKSVFFCNRVTIILFLIILATLLSQTIFMMLGKPIFSWCWLKSLAIETINNILLGGIGASVLLKYAH